MDGYDLHLAMAALVGASVVAFSAYYMHRKTLSQLLEFARSLERDDDAEDELSRRRRFPDPRPRRRKSVAAYRRSSASLTDVTRVSGEADGEIKPNGVIDGIRAGLPKLRTLSEGKSASSATHLIKPLSQSQLLLALVPSKVWKDPTKKIT